MLAIAAALVPAAAQLQCDGAIAQFRTIIDSDVETGNLHRSVYDRIQPGLKQAAALCQARRDADALRALQSLKRRHGYR
jgi:hypothetical protein